MTRNFLLIFLVFACFCTLKSQTECKITDLKVTALPCNFEKKFAVKIEFGYSNPGNQGFKVQGNGKVYGTFEYANLPIIIEGLEGNCETPYEFIVRDIAQPICSDDFQLGTICCSGDCTLDVINPVVSACKENEFYLLGFDLLTTGSKGVGFDVYLNGTEKGFYTYSALPLKEIKFPTSGLSVDSLRVCENDNGQCCDTLLIYNTCECNIHQIRTQIAECSAEAETYYLRLNFDYSKTSDSFYLGGSSELLGTFAYKDLPILIGPFNFGENIGDLLIADKESVLCFASLEPAPVEACQSCLLDDLQYKVLPCNDKGQVYVKLNFKSKNPGVKGFTIRGNGKVYGEKFQYGEEAYYIGPFEPNCNQNYEFVIVDNGNPDCRTQVNLEEKICCNECSLASLAVTPICDGEVTKIKIQYDGSANSDSLFVLINNKIVKKISASANPYQLVYEFKQNENYVLSLISATDEDCKLVKEFKFFCDEVQPCGFENIDVLFTECNADNVYYVKLKFTKVGQHNEKFKVKINNTWFGPFVFGQNFYEIGPVGPSCDGIRIQLQDVENEACQAVKEFDIKKCCDEGEDCPLSEVKSKTVCFEGDIIGMTFLVTGEEGQAFDLYLEGKLIGRYKYADLPFIVNKLLEKGFIKVKIVDVANPSCVYEYETYLSCNDCFIGNLSAKGIECTEHSAYFKVDFDHENTSSDSFYLRINNDVFGPYGYNELPVVPDQSYDPLADQTYTFKIFDANEDCGFIVNVPLIECVSFTESKTLSYQLFEAQATDGGIMVKYHFPEEVNRLSVVTLDGRMVMNHQSKPGQEVIEYKSALGHQLYILKVENKYGIAVKKIVR